MIKNNQITKQYRLGQIGGGDAARRIAAVQRAASKARPWTQFDRERRGVVKISVVMPVYNTPVPFLQEATDSILNQTFRDFEFIIVDDGSVKEVREIG